jgi:hypothetical protein
VEVHILSVDWVLGDHHASSDKRTSVPWEVKRDGEMIEVRFEMNNFLTRGQMFLSLRKRGEGRGRIDGLCQEWNNLGGCDAEVVSKLRFITKQVTNHLELRFFDILKEYRARFKFF